jgi:hypothetical protein
MRKKKIEKRTETAKIYQPIWCAASSTSKHENNKIKKRCSKIKEKKNKHSLTHSLTQILTLFNSN